MRSIIRIIFVVIGLLSTLALSAQEPDIRDYIETVPSSDSGRVVLRSIENPLDTTIFLVFEDEYSNFVSEPQMLNKGEIGKWDFTFNVIWLKSVIPSPLIEIFRSSTPNNVSNNQCLNKDNIEQRDSKEMVPSKTEVSKSQKVNNKRKSNAKKKVIPIEKVIEEFYIFLDSVPSLSAASFDRDSIFIDKHLANLQLESINKSAYIKEQKLDFYIAEQSDAILQLRNNDSILIAEFLQRYDNKDIESPDSCVVLLSAALIEKIDCRNSLIEPLRIIVSKQSRSEIHVDWKMVGVCIAIILLIILLLLWYRKANKNQHKQTQHRKVSSISVDETSEPSLVVLSHKTSSALKKQSLEDVYDNDAYFRIECMEFCNDSAIRAIYIKNTCIKDIYNMYAEDLRNPDNPKEDGCMVLGRWVLDENTQLYDVSLEYIVQPGDDAVFEKYELNFGGKIKLKVAEKLRRLRRETNLQYDLTCWVHSHPGLGVFFSNSDNNVHMQLKHPVHPKFLTALVIDILTPQQDMGIFTFRQDETINSKNDIQKMYSLEDLYKWALISERKTFDTNDYYNVLEQVKDHLNECFCIQLSNSAIIDMTFMAAKPNGFIGFVHGFSTEHGARKLHIISSVTKNETAPDSEMLGCFIVASHCSIPSIRKVVSRYISDIRFVLVYTITDGMLTSIPVINQDLCTSDNYYGEQKLEDLKIWTRRRR